MKSPSFSIKILPVNSVKLWKDNPRKNDKSAEKLAELLKVHGVKTPIVVWEKNMVVYKGNTTVKACKIAGIKEIPVILAQFKSNDDAVAYALADNKASEWSEWDDILLQKLLSSKENLKEQAKITGFTEKELTGLRALDIFESDELPDVDLQGETVGTGHFIIIRFESSKMYSKVASAFGIKEGKRVIEWDSVKDKVMV